MNVRIWTVLGGVATLGAVAVVLLVVIRMAKSARQEQRGFPITTDKQAAEDNARSLERDAHDKLPPVPPR